MKRIFVMPKKLKRIKIGREISVTRSIIDCLHVVLFIMLLMVQVLVYGLLMVNMLEIMEEVTKKIANFGIRPVVSLKQDIKTNGYALNGIWNIQL